MMVVVVVVVRASAMFVPGRAVRVRWCLWGWGVVVVLMAVVPQFGLVEQKEKNHPQQQHGKQIVRARLALKGFRQQVHERGS